MAAFLDITPLRELEQQREEFISVVAHDLRGAMTAIRGYADYLNGFLRDDSLPERARRPLEIIAASSRRADRMITDLLDASRIEARRLRLDKRPLDLPALVREIIESAGPHWDSHPVRLEFQGEIPEVEADPDRIEQILGDLLSNAVKYSYPQTEITVQLEPLPQEGRYPSPIAGPASSPRTRTGSSRGSTAHNRQQKKRQRD